MNLDENIYSPVLPECKICVNNLISETFWISSHVARRIQILLTVNGYVSEVFKSYSLRVFPLWLNIPQNQRTCFKHLLFVKKSNLRGFCGSSNLFNAIWFMFNGKKMNAFEVFSQILKWQWCFISATPNHLLHPSKQRPMTTYVLEMWIESDGLVDKKLWRKVRFDWQICIIFLENFPYS